MNVKLVADSIIKIAGLKEKFTKAIEEYSGNKVEKIKFVQDPKVPGTYAIRTTLDGEQQDWLIVHYKHEWTDKEAAEQLEEIEFDSWPPVSGGLKFF